MRPLESCDHSRPKLNQNRDNESWWERLYSSVHSWNHTSNECDLNLGKGMLHEFIPIDSRLVRQPFVLGSRRSKRSCSDWFWAVSWWKPTPESSRAQNKTEDLLFISRIISLSHSPMPAWKSRMENLEWRWDGRQCGRGQFNTKWLGASRFLGFNFVSRKGKSACGYTWVIRSLIRKWSYSVEYEQVRWIYLSEVLWCA